MTEFPLPTPDSGPYDLVVARNGSIWFTEADGNRIGRITTAGEITEFAVPTADSDPYVLAAGPDGNTWFTESNANQIGRITASGESISIGVRGSFFIPFR